MANQVLANGGTEMLFEQIVAKCESARQGNYGVLSTGEQLMAALVLNRMDWLSEAGYTILQALNRIGPEWAALIPRVAQALGRGKPDSYRELLVIALANNDYVWLGDLGCTIAQALEILGPSGTQEVQDEAARFTHES